MLTGALILAALARGAVLPGRHLVVAAHADDESISFGGALSCLSDARIVQLTGTPQRSQERRAAFAAAGWTWPVIECGIRDRATHQHLAQLRPIIAGALADVDVVWTHPYEGGHLDHDTAAWLVQDACAGRSVIRMEFASYHCAERKQVFGDFWPDARVASVTVRLGPDVYARKRAALDAYASQAAILRKFQTPEREAYRMAPVYNFSRPSAPPRCRWDVKGYTPTTAEWRRTVASEVAA